MTPEGARVAVGEGPIVDAWIDPRTGDLSVISSTKVEVEFLQTSSGYEAWGD
jgi:hypothetical protein